MNIIRLEKRNETRKTATFLSRSLPPRTNTILAFIGTVKDRAYAASAFQAFGQKLPDSRWNITANTVSHYAFSLLCLLLAFHELISSINVALHHYHQFQFLGCFANGDQLDCV